MENKTKEFIPQRTQAWKDLRVGKFTASTFGDCMGTGKAKGRDFTIPGYTLIQEKVAEKLTGQQKEISGKALEWGEAYEDEAIALYEKITGEKVTEAPFVPLEGYEDDAGGSPDGFVGDMGILEVKCPYNSANHIESLETGDIPAKMERKYFTQMQFNMLAAKKLYCDFVSYDPRIKDEELRIVIKRVQSDEVYQSEIIERLNSSILLLKRRLISIEIQTKFNRRKNNE